MARLILESGAEKREFRIGGALVIGRQKDCDVLIEDGQLSRQHTRVSFQGRGYFVEDLGSRNGTRLNGQPVSGAQLLRPGDLIKLGQTTLKFLLDEDDQGLPDEVRTPRSGTTGTQVPASEVPPPAPAPPLPGIPDPAANPAVPKVRPAPREKEPLVVEGPSTGKKTALWILLLLLGAAATWGAKEAFVWALRRAFAP